MSHRNEKQEFYDPARSVFLNLKDDNLKKEFAKKLASFKDGRAPKDILINIARTSGWNLEDIKTLAQVSSDQFYELFKKTESADLRIIVTQALEFERYGDAVSDMKCISINARDALKRIASESRFNEERVSSYGVTLEKKNENLPENL